MKHEFQQKIRANYLRLQATSFDDLKVLSALLQDSIVQVADILYTPSQKKVIMILQRFRWELTKGAETIGKKWVSTLPMRFSNRKSGMYANATN